MKNMCRYLMLSSVFFVSSCVAETTDYISKEYSVCTVAFNYHERFIDKYKILEGNSCVGSAHGKAPGETYGDGGGYMCGCSIKRHRYVTVEWTDALSYKEDLAGKKAATYSKKVTLPTPQSSTSRYLQIHFLSNNRVVLDWVDDIRTPRIDPISGKIK